MRAVVWFFTALVSMTPVMRAAAQPPPPASTTPPPTDLSAQAEEQFRQGREAFKQGDYTRALGLFEASQAIFPSLGTLLNIGNCEEKLGKISSAWKRFQKVLAELPAEDPRRSFVTQRIAEIEPRVPRLWIVVAPGTSAMAKVVLDGAELAPASLGTELRLDPGKHIIVVSAPGRPERRYTTNVEEGKRATIMVAPGVVEEPAVVLPAPSSDEPAPVNPTPPAPSNTRRTAGIVVSTIGLSGLAIGGITGVLALIKKGQVVDACADPMRCTQEGATLASAGRTLSIASTTAFALGAVGTGLGVLLVVLGDERAPPPKRKAALSLTPTPDGGRIRLEGRF